MKAIIHHILTVIHYKFTNSRITFRTFLNEQLICFVCVIWCKNKTSVLACWTHLYFRSVKTMCWAVLLLIFNTVIKSQYNLIFVNVV